ncbi:hypothetical protein R5R35_011605 [Gryllus longicercus]|uniref:SKICH domain-containing protein n=2 Tax=Gryllus longicercus TaxID=2509291 RepID=A0AAN9VHY3_9ORTH
MIYLNCNQLPSSGHLASAVNCVIFDNVKTEYRGDEDITIEYILDSDTEPSSRNWIGLYPKGATQLDQYVTFEWTIVNPSNEYLKQHKITFHAKYHMKSVEADKEYFFIFVNKQMKVIGSSSYFCFLFYHTLEIDDLKVPEKVGTRGSSTPESLKSLSEENVLKDGIDKEILQELHYHTTHLKHKQHMQLSSTHTSDSISQNISGFKADVTLTSPDFPVSNNSSLSNNNNNFCALCKRPSNFAEIEQRLNAKIKMYAEYGHTLEKRIEELEKNFEMSQVAQKQLKLIAYHAKREKTSYQKFVNEMLSVLTSKGAVRILDGHGTELLLKRVDITQSENKGASIMSRKSHREEILKSVISSQESTIRELMAKLENYSLQEKENPAELEDEITVLDKIHTNKKQMNAMEKYDSALPAIAPLKPDLEKDEAKKRPDENVNVALNESLGNTSDNHELNETYSIDNLVGEPVSVILPLSDYRQTKNQSYEESRNSFASLDDGQGDFHYKSLSSKENIHDIKENVMKELRNAIRKRQDKSEKFKSDPCHAISNESFNLSINETVQSTSVEEPNALIIKGERLQYAIIREHWTELYKVKMGAAGSVQSNEVNSDPSLSPHSLPQQSASDGLPEDTRATQTNTETNHKEVRAIGEELWLKQIQDLGKIVQNLASENLKLIDSNRELKQKCEQQESVLNERNRCEDKKEEIDENLQMVTNLQKEAANDKKLIEDLKQQLQTNTENNAIEVEKYHENLNFMRMKVKEYEQVVEKLEKNAVVQNDAIQSLQSTISSVDCQGNLVEQNASEMKDTIEALKQSHEDCQQEKKDLEEQLEEERNLRRKISDEKQKLQEEFVQIKQTMRLNVVKTSENSDADGSDLDINGEPDQSACASGSRSEEARALSPRAAAELQVFQKQMKVKREARHKALSAISMEMERLRRELNNEREVRHKAVKELEDARNISDPHHIFEEVNALRHKLTSEQQEKDRIYKEMLKIQKEGNEEIENILKQLEREKTKTDHLMGENKFFKEQLEECEQKLEFHSEENTQLQNKFETDRQKFQQQVLALKDVVAISKQMLTVRENQVTHLKQTLQDVEATVIQKHRGSLTAELRAEYETQMENIKALKALYEERMQVMNVEKEKLVGEQKELQRLIEEEKIIVENLETKLQEKEEIIMERNATVSDLQDQLSDAIDQSRNLSYELTLINNMFTQILGSSEMDLDRLTKLLQENHDLITEITTKGNCESEITASLPKLLLDLVSRAENTENIAGDKESSDQISDNASCSTSFNAEQNEATVPFVSVNTNGSPLAMQDISSNLPKVWKVLLELVSHHVPSPSEETEDDSKTSCYKRVDTPHGPKNVISVSKTFLRLRDLILQKKSLQKEVTRLKQLNVHLETKLNDQERRLSLVSTELRKTWNVVDHMRVQHQQLHTHEKVLRYELQEKRKLLMELKEELEYCREKWEDARQKNSQSETEWQKLRKEFALRKNKPLNNSGESGFSEEKDDDNSDNDGTKMQTQRKSSNSGFTDSQKRDSTDQSVTKSEDPEAVNSSASSLPDLVAVTADLSLPPTNVAGSIGAIPSNEIIGRNNDSILQNIVQDTFSLDSDSSGPPILEPSLLEECPTVSLITLLKQQLSCFSKNLDIITTGFDTNDHFRALQSIFALPAIQIPENLNPPVEPGTSYLQKARASIDRGIQVTEECHDKVNESEVSVCEIDSPHFSKSDEVLQKHGKSITNSVETPSSSSSIQPHSTVGQENVSSPASEAECPREESCLESTDACSNSENINSESRSERLQRMERQCQQLFDKVTRRSETSRFTSDEPKDQNKSQENSDGPARNFEDMLDARAARLKRLEEQSQQLFKKVTRTTHRSTELSNRLEELHEQYGSEDIPGSTTVDNTPQNMPSDSILREVPIPTNDQKLSDQATSDTSEDLAISLPGPSVSHIPPPSLEDKLDARAARLKRLEEQSQQLFNKVTKTTQRSTELSNRLEELHEQYNNEEAEGNALSLPEGNSSLVSDIPKPPPFPDHLLQANLLVSARTVENEKVVQTETACSTSSSSSHIPSPPSLEGLLDARAARLKRLEEQSQQLFKKVKRTTHRSTELSNRLEQLHDQYGSEDSTGSVTHHSTNSIPPPPPLPEHLGAMRLPTTCLPSSSSHIPTPPPLPENLPSVRLPAKMDQPTSSNNEEQDVCDEEKEQR